MKIPSGRIVIALIILLAMTLYDVFYISPAASKLHKELIAMHQEITPIQGASFLDEVGHMRNGGEITRVYTTNASPQEIITHYDKEFRRNGWTYRKTEVVHDPETNEIIKIAIYAKNNHYGGSVGYPGEPKAISTIVINFESYSTRKY